jgi:hypothetical protein
VFVVTADGVRYPDKIIGMRDQADIALLRIDAGREPMPFVRFGDSDKVRVGDKVIAIGSPFDDYLQTDAAINHGSSGGPPPRRRQRFSTSNGVSFAFQSQTASWLNSKPRGRNISVRSRRLSL